MGKDLNGRELGTGIDQRKGGEYRVRYRGSDGSRYAVYAKTYEQALAIREQYDVDEESHRGKTEVTDPGTLTVDEWFNIWRNVYVVNKCKAVTVGIYDRTYRNHIKCHLGGKRLQDVTRPMIQRIFNDLTRRGYKKGTQELICVLLHAMMDAAVDDGYLEKNPVVRITKGGEDKGKIKYLDSEMMPIVMSVFEGVPDIKDLLEFILNTGLRIGEATALNMQDIDLERRTASITKTEARGDGCTVYTSPKTKSSKRVVPLNDAALEIVSRRINGEARPADGKALFFRSKTGKRIVKGIVAYEMERANDRIHKMEGCEDFPMISPHMFRHTFATHCFEAGVPAKAVQTFLGHSTINTTLNTYTHVDEDFALENIQKICL